MAEALRRRLRRRPTEAGVLCFFCQEGIETKGLDPCGLRLSIRYPNEDGADWLQLFCHFDCLAKHDNPEFRLLPDFE